jgi:hypothetical protein
MNLLEAALSYATRGWRLFPVGDDKHPLIKNWPLCASTDPATIEEWWKHWPGALIGTPTGERFVVLDVDVKSATAYGPDTLAELCPILPDTPIAHTRSGGFHLYFAPPKGELRNTNGGRGRGIGPGLDWRGTGGFVIIPPSGGYWWDPSCNLDIAAFAPVPTELLPHAPTPCTTTRPVRSVSGLSPYAEAALDSAVERILHAANGEQEVTLHYEAYSIGRLAGAGAVPAGFARDVLQWASHRLPNHDPRRPWRPSEAQEKVDRAFALGQ